jgi:hypothetical protein
MSELPPLQSNSSLIMIMYCCIGDALPRGVISSPRVADAVMEDNEAA